jgi:hypothetical protein
LIKERSLDAAWLDDQRRMILENHNDAVELRSTSFDELMSQIKPNSFLTSVPVSWWWPEGGKREV